MSGKANNAQEIMTQIMQNLEAKEYESGMESLFQFLRNRRGELSTDKWKSFVSSEVLTHPIRSLIHKDPFTYRAFTKPRGYPGDAVILDYIYGCGTRGVSEDMTGKGVYAYTMSTPAARAVRFRRNLIAEIVDRISDTLSYPIRILSLAAGHLREAEISKAVREKCIGEFIAFDYDEKSLEVVHRDYSQFGVSTVQGSVRQVLAGKHEFRNFDFVYAAGLFDYLTHPVGRRLVQIMFNALGPKGELLIANFAPDIHDVGYMESFMDWYLIYRNDNEALDLLSLLPKHEIKEVTLSHDPDKNIVFIAVQKIKEGALPVF